MTNSQQSDDQTVSTPDETETQTPQDPVAQAANDDVAPAEQDVPDDGRTETDQPDQFSEGTEDTEDAPSTDDTDDDGSHGESDPSEATPDEESTLEEPGATPPPAPQETVSEALVPEPDPVTATDSAADEPAAGEPASDRAEPAKPASDRAEPAEPAAVAAAPTATPTPTPKPTAKPTPASIPTPAAVAKPSALRPAAPSSKTESAVVPPVSQVNIEEAARWGRAEDDGTVYLTVDGEEQVAGQYPGVERDEALAYFARKYNEVHGRIELLEQRVHAHAPTSDMRHTLDQAREQVTARAMVGDVRDLERRLDALADSITELEAAEKAAQQAAREEAIKAREAIVAEAEALAAKDPQQVVWKTSSARMNELFETWKNAQKQGPRVGKSTEDGLWKRFRAARTTHDRHRRAFFSQLDETNAAAKTEKEKLIAEAEALSKSTEWGPTSGQFRDLMDRWKAAPRASRREDDALWARFRAAQDAFFTARQKANDEIDEEYRKNLIVKEELIAEAKALLPIKDLAAAKKALQSIRDRWDDAGKVPRGDMQRIDAQLRSVEDAVRDADQDHWKRTNPETKARTNSMLDQLEAAIDGLRDDLATAEQAGDQRKIDAAREALQARQQWLDQLQKSAQDFR